MASPCSCRGPDQPDGPTAWEHYAPGIVVTAAGVDSYVRGAIFDRTPQRQAGAMGLGLGATMVGLAIVGDLAAVILETERIHPWDVRNATAQRRDALRAFASGLGAATVPMDEADRVALRERLHAILAAHAVPDDPCGWYRFGWATQNNLMEALLEDAGLSAGLVAMADAGDGADIMRLASVPGLQPCPRFWFGMRDSNRSLAAAVVDAGLA